MVPDRHALPLHRAAPAHRRHHGRPPRGHRQPRARPRGRGARDEPDGIPRGSHARGLAAGGRPEGGRRGPRDGARAGGHPRGAPGRRRHDPVRARAGTAGAGHLYPGAGRADRGGGRRAARPLVRAAGGGSPQVLKRTSCAFASHPFDVVGWDGCLYPYVFDIADYEPIRSETADDHRDRARRLAVRAGQPALRRLLRGRIRAPGRHPAERHRDRPRRPARRRGVRPAVAERVHGPGVRPLGPGASADRRAGGRRDPGRGGARRRRRHPAPPHRGGRLRGLLRLRAPRREPRPDVPPGQPRPADAQLEAPADRLPRAAGSIVVSGTDIVRPCGQRKGKDDPAPVFGPSVRLDIEAELGFVVGTGTAMGESVPVEEAERRIFGVVLFNDWSPRDIQAWEYVPLGPNLGKSFASTISPWVVPLLALQPAKVPTPVQEPEPLPYLAMQSTWGLDVDLSVEWNGQVVSRPPYREMYWSPAQMLAHLTVNGAPSRTGDLFASGTVSGREKETRGAFIELTWGGAEPVTVGGEQRTFLEDGDEVVLTATAPGPNGTRLGFGEARGRILPSTRNP